MWEQNAVGPGLFQLTAHGWESSLTPTSSQPPNCLKAGEKTSKAPHLWLMAGGWGIAGKVKIVSRAQKGGEVVVGCKEVGTASILSSQHPQFLLHCTRRAQWWLGSGFT